jgi:hypothetical protein
MATTSGQTIMVENIANPLPVSIASTVLTSLGHPPGTEILCAQTATNATTMISVPANRWYKCQISVSIAISGAGAGAATVTWNPGGTNCGPTASVPLAKAIAASSIAGQDSSTVTTDMLLFGGDSGGSLFFTTGGGTIVSANINGFLI